ncbi:MAG: ECF transporter S component [Chloroflexota bacterium]|jgi:energy-coupling factor transport system substrate-specific component
MRRTLSATIYALSALVGLVAFVYPLVLSALVGPERAAESQSETPLLAMALLLLGLGALLIEMQGRAVNARMVATLGLLVAATSVLRFLETAIPGPGGFSPIFVPIILAGYVYGPRFGFLMGALSLLASAVITGGVGPWLPYQVFAAGWVGLTAGWLPHLPGKRRELALLTAFAFGWGLLFGAILNLYYWPYLSGSAAGELGADNTLAGSDAWGGLARYGAFYLTTSFAWDLVRALGNALLVLAIGLPVLRALRRFRDRMHFEAA